MAAQKALQGIKVTFEDYDQHYEDKTSSFVQAKCHSAKEQLRSQRPRAQGQTQL